MAMVLMNRLARTMMAAVVLCGCSGQGDSSAVQASKPLPVLVQLETDQGLVELRGYPQIEVLEGGPVSLVIEAANEDMSMSMSLRLAETWTGSVGELAETVELAVGTQSQIHFGATPETGVSGEGRARVSVGRTVQGAFEAGFEGVLMQGSFKGQPSLSCGVLGASEEERGGSPANSNDASWSFDPDRATPFCQSVAKALDL